MVLTAAHTQSSLNPIVEILERCICFLAEHLSV
jgi:hypothetical protein